MRLLEVRTSPAENMDSYWRISSIVLLTHKEAGQVQSLDLDALHELFEVGCCTLAHYSGPGRPFVGTPSFHVHSTGKRNWARVNQIGGLDI